MLTIVVLFNLRDKLLQLAMFGLYFNIEIRANTKSCSQ